jgi:hypothetical protein
MGHFSSTHYWRYNAASICDINIKNTFGGMDGPIGKRHVDNSSLSGDEVNHDQRGASHEGWMDGWMDDKWSGNS